MEDVELDIQRELALNIIMNNIAEFTREYSITKDKNKSTELKEKVDVLNKIKEEIYLGNTEIINKVIEKNKKGML